ncbi:MAG: FG-GAP-like repeat-containing protein, partial [Elainellaceae cyanobacterium]
MVDAKQLPDGSVGRSLVVIDSQLPDHQHLAAGVLPSVNLLVLEPQADSITQITTALHQYRHINRLHIVCHGSPGTLHLGNLRVNAATLSHYTSHIKQWFAPEPGEPSPILLLYGCQVAATTDGMAFLAQLQTLTGAVIYASSTRIGCDDLDGNWDLDVCLDAKLHERSQDDHHQSARKPSLAFQAATLNQYASVLAPAVLAIMPTANDTNAATGSSIELTFSESINAATVTDQTLIVRSSQRGAIAGTVNTSGSTVTFTPTESFQFGELIEVTVTSGIQNTTGEAATAVNHQFRAETLSTPGSTTAPGTFSNTGSSFRNSTDTADTVLVGFNSKTFLGDVDGDGDLDALVTANAANPTGNKFYINTNGHFIESSASLPANDSRSASLGDFDRDGDLDVLIANDDGDNFVYLNQGNGTFDPGISLADGLRSRGVATGDLDGDGDLDAFVINFQTPSRVYLNDGSGGFMDSGQALGDTVGTTDRGADVVLGDLDGDGDLDAIVAETGQTSYIWVNQGEAQAGVEGEFSLGASLGSFDATAIALGDLDGDGDLDAVMVSNAGGEDSIWFNDGGVFTESDQTTGYFEFDSGRRRDVALGDVDGDGDLDIAVATQDANRIWLNDGSGSFTSNGQFLSPEENYGIALGDVDRDGDLDLLANNTTSARWYANQVVPIGVDSTTSDGAYSVGQTIVITVTFGDIVTVDTAGGTPTLTLETGTTDGIATYTGGSGTSTLTFAYTIAEGENSSDLDYASSSALNLNGGTITDSSGGDVDLGLPAPGQTGSLRANRAIVVDTVNDAPSLGNDTLNAIDEDTLEPAGEAIASLFDGAFNEFDDPDPNSSMSGLAIVGNAANAVDEGTWQYSTDSGGTWYDIGSVSNTNALAIANTATALLRFVPTAEYSGTPSQLVVRALDNTYDQGFTSGTSRVLIDASVNGGMTAIAANTTTLQITVNPVNDEPTISLTPTITNLAEDADTSTPIEVAVVNISDVDSGTNVLDLVGLDEADFEIIGNVVYLRAGVTLDFETKDQYQVNVTVDDTSVGTSPDDSQLLTLAITDVNEAPTITLTPTITDLAEDADTSADIEVAVISVSDDALGTNELDLAGADPDAFKIVGDRLYLTAGASLDFETKDQYQVNVTVDDASIGASPDDSQLLTLAITDVNEAPTITLTPTITDLAEDADTSADIEVAVISVSDDALGTNVLDLMGADRDAFKIVGNLLYLAAGASLDFETKDQYQVSVTVDDASIGATPDDSQLLTLAITDVNEAPTITLTPTITDLAEDADTS